MSEVKALRAALESRDAQLSRQNAGLVQMARERDAAVAECGALQAALASVTAECARLRSDLDVEREQNAAFVREIERLRVVEAGAAIMRRVLNEVGRHAGWASTVRDCLRDGAGSAFLTRLVSAERDLAHARQELELDRKCSAQALDAAGAEVESIRAEVKRLKAFEAADLQRRAILEAMNGGG